MKRLKSANNGDGIEILIVKVRVIFQLSVDLMNSQWDYGFIIDWLVLFFVGVHSDVAVISRL
jgi:hypothetical protein